MKAFRLRKSVWIEMGAVGLIFILLLVVIVPQFKLNQQRALPKLLLEDMASVINALQEYRLDHNMLPPYWPQRGNIEFTLLDRIERLVENEYLQRVPSSFEKIPNKNGRSFFMLHFFDKSSVENTESSSKNKDQRDYIIKNSYHFPIPNLCFFIKWPYASSMADTEFNDYLNISTGHFLVFQGEEWKNNIRNDNPPDYTIPIIYEGAAFSPTNGLDSAGFLYIDIWGNQYPNIELDTKIRKQPQKTEPYNEKYVSIRGIN